MVDNITNHSCSKPGKQKHVTTTTDLYVDITNMYKYMME